MKTLLITAVLVVGAGALAVIGLRRAISQSLEVQNIYGALTG